MYLRKSLLYSFLTTFFFFINVNFYLFIHINKIDHIVEHDEALLELPQVDPNATQELINVYDNIGKNVALL